MLYPLPLIFSSKSLGVLVNELWNAAWENFVLVGSFVSSISNMQGAIKFNLYPGNENPSKNHAADNCQFLNLLAFIWRLTLHHCYLDYTTHGSISSSKYPQIRETSDGGVETK